MSQCDATYLIYDKEGELLWTFFCLKEKGHKGLHSHFLQWEEGSHDLILHKKPKTDSEK